MFARPEGWGGGTVEELFFEPSECHAALAVLTIEEVRERFRLGRAFRDLLTDTWMTPLVEG